MKNKIKIRYCKSSELLKIISLTANAYSVLYKSSTIINKPYESLERIKNDIKNGTKILVAEEDGDLVGAVRFNPENLNVLKLNRLAVLSEYRNKGIGGLLINSVLKIAKEQNFRIVAIEVMEEKGLISFYEKFGFKIKDRKKHQNHQDVFMEKSVR